MMKIVKKLISGLLIMTLLILPRAKAVGFSDVQNGNWAESAISKAVELGIMNGYGGERFGPDDNVTRAQFATMLMRLFNWSVVNPQTPTFTDNADQTAWYYGAIESAVKNGAIPIDGTLFRPKDDITREEMAVMLVRGLGYTTLTASLKNVTSPFTDVSSNGAYIAMAYDFGIINGTGEGTFSPASYATRAQAAAMMIRLYDRYESMLNWTHAFYAVDSYKQKDLMERMDAISFGWSRLDYAETGGATLNTTSADGNTFNLPAGYDAVVAQVKGRGISDHLSVYMSAARKLTLSDGTVTNPCDAILHDAGQRTKAVQQIITELQRESNYSGVTIDFEEMRGMALKSDFTSFLTELKSALQPFGYTLFVCVSPVTSDGYYFDAYDYKAIGDVADKVILMAHDYAATSLNPAEMDAGFTTTPVTPIYEIYTALQAITNEATGVTVRQKIALAISFNSCQWKLVNGKVVSANAYHPDSEAIAKRLLDPAATLNYSDKYQNPFITYHNTEDNTDNIIWYEDVRSVQAKTELAKMFGVTSLSFWRLGLIPTYDDSAERQLYDNIPAWLQSIK